MKDDWQCSAIGVLDCKPCVLAGSGYFQMLRRQRMS